MTLDQELLNKARESEAKLKEIERQALLAKAEYHTHIRRLHLAGGSLREIGQELGLSHQRIQQMVFGAGGSWWQRWRSRVVKRDAVCTFCERPPSEISKLISGPNVYICDSCVGSAEKCAEGCDCGGALCLVSEGTKKKCSFCDKKGATDRALVAGSESNVCCECLTLCRQILDSEKRAP